MPTNNLIRLYRLKNSPKSKVASNDKKRVAPNAKEKLEKEKELKSLLQEVLFYILFLALLSATAISCRDYRAFEYKVGTFKQLDGIDKVSKTEGIWTWLDTALFPFLYPATDWYDMLLNKSMIPFNFKRESLLVAGLASYRLGQIRVRQHRMKSSNCTVLPALTEVGVRCEPPWSQAYRDSADYTPGWGEGVLRELNDTGNITEWEYQRWMQIGGAPLYGEMGLYPPGGYVASLGVDRPNAKAKVAALRSQHWLDELTRVVIVEVTLYTPNTNMFACLTAVFEYEQPHAIKAHLRFQAFTLFVHGYPLARQICDALVGLVLIWMGGRVVPRLVKRRWSYFTSVWDILHLVNFFTSLAAIVLYVGRHVISTTLTTTVQTLNAGDQGNVYNFQSLALWDELFGYVLAFVCFLSVLQFLPLLRFNKRMAMLALTLKLAWKDLPSFAFVFLVVMFAFVSFSYIMFGRAVYSYSSVKSALQSLSLIVLGYLDYAALSSVHKAFAPLFLFLYMFCVVFILVNMLVTILMDAFAEVRADDDHILPDHELWDYFVSKLTNPGCRPNVKSYRIGVDQSVFSVEGENKSFCEVEKVNESILY